MRIDIPEAVSLLKNGEVVAIPSETVYGLAAGLYREEAVDKIFKLKNRPLNNPLIIHTDSLEEIELLSCDFPKEARDLAEAFWPGPLTLVLPCKDNIPEKIRAGLPTAAFRIPNHPLTLKLLKSVGPVVAPSANLSGRPSATTPEHVEEDFGENFPVLDGGACIRGLESTILGYHEGSWEVYRLGAIPAEAFFDILGYIPGVLKLKKGENPLCPGQLYRHYAPKAHLALSEEFVPCQVIIGYSNRKYPEGYEVLHLGHSDNPIEVSQNLYSVLRKLDQQNIDSAWVDMRIPNEGIWSTIIERLQKAASTEIK